MAHMRKNNFCMIPSAYASHSWCDSHKLPGSAREWTAILALNTTHWRYDTYLCDVMMCLPQIEESTRSVHCYVLSFHLL